MSAIASMKALLESGVHFGHRTNKWDPAMKPYIFTERNGIHIIDLQQTVKNLSQSYNVVRDTVMAGGTVLFVGTKRQAQETIREEAERCGMPYVIERWLGGTITNWVTIHQRILELERLEQMRDSGEIQRLTKKEGLLIEREINRLLTRLSGIRKMKTIPDLLFVIDVSREATAVHEANLKNIPVIALVDTNCNPRGVDYVIPSNDDAIRAIKLLVGKIADAVLEGKSLRKDDYPEAKEGPVDEVKRTPAEIRARLVIEDEKEDEELLGEATLAKLGGRRVVDEDFNLAEVEGELEVTAVEVTEAPAKAKKTEKAEKETAKGEAPETAQSESEKTEAAAKQSKPKAVKKTATAEQASAEETRQSEEEEKPRGKKKTA